ESFESLFIQQLMTALANPPKEQDDAQDMVDMINIISKPDMERQIKVMIARQLGQIDSAAMGMDGPGGTVIVTERNKAALDVLLKTVNGGKKNIAIFYGAAHLPDMTRRLAGMGFTPVATNWNVAWDLKIRADRPSGFGVLLNNIFGPATR